MLELRCENILHGIVLEPGLIEVKCRSSHCGAGVGVMVVHRLQISDDWSSFTFTTRKFRNPIVEKGSSS